MAEKPESPTGRTYASPRSGAYSLFSQLVASPFDAPSVTAALPPVDLAEAAEKLREQLPYELDLEPLATAAAGLGEADAERLATAYSGLFEVGSSGAPIPLREEHANASAEKAKEETLRFYDFFGYTLADERQWAPDHLSVQRVRARPQLAVVSAHGRSARRVQTDPFTLHRDPP